MVRRLAVIGIVIAALLGACGSSSEDPLAGSSRTPALTISSSAFAAGAAIPADFTCDGAGNSPPLAWSGVPAQTKALALIVDDTDAGGFTHWLVYDMPPSVTALAAGVPQDATLADGSKQGKNGFDRTGYGGPCPPGSSEHHYRFRIYALDAPLNLESGRSKGDVSSAMSGHILAFGELIALYKRGS